MESDWCKPSQMLGGGSWSLFEYSHASLFSYWCINKYMAEIIKGEGQIVLCLLIGASCVDFKERKLIMFLCIVQWHQINDTDF